MKHLCAITELQRDETRVVQTYDSWDEAHKQAQLYAAHIRRNGLQQQYGIGVARDRYYRYNKAWLVWAVTVHRYSVEVQMKNIESDQDAKART